MAIAAAASAYPEWPDNHISLESLRVRNFRCFEDREFDFSPQFNLLVGENAKGKTTLIQAVSSAMVYLIHELTGLHSSGELAMQDVRLRQIQSPEGDVLAHQFPVEVEACAVSTNLRFCWSLKKDTSESSAEVDISTGTAFELWKEKNRLAAGTYAPIFAYYGTNSESGYSQSTQSGKSAYVSQSPSGPPNRAEAYEGCLTPGASSTGLEQWLRDEAIIEFDEGVPRKHTLVVRKAIASCIEKATDVLYSRRHKRVVVQFGDTYQYLSNLSHGQLRVLAMVGDLASRAVLLNGFLGEEVLLKTPGIVMIDELDLHLHPKWQRRVIDDLKQVFPNIQFLATTHSPFLIQAVKPGELVDLHREAEDRLSQASYADQSIEDILTYVMNIQMPEKSQRYQDMEKAARDYYLALRDPKISDEKLERLEYEMALKMAPYGDNPSLHALLNVEKLYWKEKNSDASGE